MLIKLHYLADSTPRQSPYLGDSRFSAEAREIKASIVGTAKSRGETAFHWPVALDISSKVAGHRLKTFRETLGLSQLQMAQVFGICREHYARYEAGTKPIPNAQYVTLYRLELAHDFDYWLAAQSWKCTHELDFPTGTDRLAGLMISAGPELWNQYWDECGAYLTPIPGDQDTPQYYTTQIAQARRGLEAALKRKDRNELEALAESLTLSAEDRERARAAAEALPPVEPAPKPRDRGNTKMIDRFDGEVFE